jgi:DNA-binding transcriptional LysR family regulator
MYEFSVLGSSLSFSHAAEKLFLSQSTLSRHIAYIEEELGESLLSRSTHYVNLTTAGEIALDAFKSITALYDGFLEKLSDLKKGCKGRLSVGTLLSSTDRYMSVPLCNFKKAFPDTTVSISTYQRFEVVHDILNGRVDIGLACRLNAPECFDDSLGCYDIGRERYHAALPKNHPLAEKEALHWEDLDGKAILLFKNDILYNSYIERLLKNHNVSPKVRIYTEQFETIKSDLINSNCITLVPEHIPGEITMRDIVFIPLEESDAVLNISYFYRKDNANPTFKLFMNTLKEA